MIGSHRFDAQKRMVMFIFYTFKQNHVRGIFESPNPNGKNLQMTKPGKQPLLLISINFTPKTSHSCLK